MNLIVQCYLKCESNRDKKYWNKQTCWLFIYKMWLKVSLSCFKITINLLYYFQTLFDSEWNIQYNKYCILVSVMYLHLQWNDVQLCLVLTDTTQRFIQNIVKHLSRAFLRWSVWLITAKSCWLFLQNISIVDVWQVSEYASRILLTEIISDI